MGEQRRSSRQANLLKFHLVGTKRAWPESWSSAISVTWEWLENCKLRVLITKLDLLLTINQNPLFSVFHLIGSSGFLLLKVFDGDVYLIFRIQVVLRIVIFGHVDCHHFALLFPDILLLLCSAHNYVVKMWIFQVMLPPPFCFTSSLVENREREIVIIDYCMTVNEFGLVLIGS